MKRKTKWVEISSPDQRVSEIAKLALVSRLESVWYYLSLSAKHAEEDIEYVHQLRVSSRRAVAALKMFQDLIPRKRYKAACRRLANIRQAAGVARDDDVMFVRLTEEADPGIGPGSAELVAQLQDHRDQAQHAISVAYKRSRRKKWKKANRDLISRIAWREESIEPKFSDWARDQLKPAISSFVQIAARVADGEGKFSEVKTLHALRIKGKRLRYSMELVAAAFPAAFRQDLYPLVEQLQERLGDLNDHATAGRRYQKWLDSSIVEETSAELSLLAQNEHDSVGNSVQEFHEWWRRPQSAALRAELNAILARD